MPTNNYIENSFWNFDALFQPQQHPARDAHDTFFVSGKFLCSGFGGFRVACWPLVPKFAGSSVAEAVGF
jgi:phenylalanyl-tRNA synthetase alpha subunit